VGKGAQGKKEKKAEKKGGDGSWPQVWASHDGVIVTWQ
jgi:hypothetical protein